MNPTSKTPTCPRLFSAAARRSTRLATLLCAALLLPSATVCAQDATVSASPLSETAAYQMPENPTELLRFDDEMRAYFGKRIDRHTDLESKIDQVVAAILSERGLHFTYEEDGLYDVREAFRRRRGNCVTFSLLVVAVAREYRIAAEFNEVPIRPRWSRTGGLVLESRHLNVLVENGGVRYEIDLKRFDDLRIAPSASRTVSDERAFAGMYSNVGVYRLAAGDRAGALRLLELATKIEPEFAPAWANLGGVHLLAGDNESARHCYEQALAAEPGTMAAISALAWMYRDSGRLDEAKWMERTATRYRERNPYYLLSAAREAFDQGKLESARRHLARAIRIKSDEPEFYELMVQVSRGLGFEREAARYSRRLDEARRPVVAAVH